MRNDKFVKGSIYAVLFSNGSMKVGVTRGSGAARIQTHQTRARVVGASKVREHVVGVLTKPHDCERELLKFCGSKFNSLPIFGREWFQDVSPSDFDDVVAAMLHIASLSAGLAHRCPTPVEARVVQKMFGVPRPVVSGRSDPEFMSALVLAKVMQTMISDEMITGPVFDSKPSLGGISYFTLTMAIYLTDLSEFDRAARMCDIVHGLDDDDYQGVFDVLKVAEAAAAIRVKAMLAADAAPASTNF